MKNEVFLYLLEYSLLFTATSRPSPVSKLSSFILLARVIAAFLTAGFHVTEVGVSNNSRGKIMDSGFISGIITFVSSISGSLLSSKYN